MSKNIKETANIIMRELTFKVTDINRTFPFLHGGSLQITLTVPLTCLFNSIIVNSFRSECGGKGRPRKA